MAEPTSTRAGVVQITSTDDVDRNLAAVERTVRAAVAEEASIVLVPEGYAAAHVSSLADETPEGRSIVQRAVELGVGDEAVSMAQLTREGAQFVPFTAQTRMSGVDLADGTRLSESDTVEAGDELVVSPTAFGGLGLSICYDLRFPELYRKLVEAGAVALAIPAAFTATT